MNANLAKFAEATNFDLLDETGEWLIIADQTNDTIEQFIESSNSWAECSSDQIGEIAGFPFVAWNNAQARKGDKRKSISVIDFGDFRYVLEEDLTDYED